jgi:hypothetical protein
MRSSAAIRKQQDRSSRVWRGMRAVGLGDGAQHLAAPAAIETNDEVPAAGSVEIRGKGRAR